MTSVGSLLSAASTKSERSSILGLVALGVLPLYLAEFVASARAVHWIGLRPGEWFLTLGPPLFYWGLIAAGTLAIDRGLSKLVKNSRAQSFFPLVASCATTMVLCSAIRFGLESRLHSDLGYGLLASLATLCLAWPLLRVAGFSFGPAFVAGTGAVAAAALSLHNAGSTMMIRAFGFEAAATVSLQYAVVIGSLGLVAGTLAARRPQVGWLVAIALCLFGVGTPAISRWQMDAVAAGRGNEGPNILLVTADSMRADYASLYGGQSPTPVLEALASSGAKFDHAISLAPWTVPSLSGLFSSKYPPSVTPGIRGEERDQQLTLYGQIPAYWLGALGQSLPRRLRDRGYDTAAFVANFAMRKQRWLIDDFDYHLVMQPLMKELRGPFAKSPFLSCLLQAILPSFYELHPFDHTRAVTALSRRFIRYHKGERFFLWAHFLDPHSPYDPPEAYRSMSGPFPFYPYQNRRHDWDKKDYIRSLYAGEISYVDDSIGEILDILRELDLDDRTYVVFTSDHGEELWDHSDFGHGHSVYDELLRVPLVIAGPGIPAQVVSRTVSTIDLLPTLADWTNLAADPEWRGSSWAAALAQGSFEPGETPVFAQATGVLPPPPEPLQAVVLGNYKLVRGMESGKLSLYDRGADPSESINRADALPGITRKLKRALNRWSKSFPVSFDVFAAEGENLEPDPEMIENLKLLGYLPSDSP
jgi:arylsulfatase